MSRLRIVTIGIVALLSAACGPGGASFAPTAAPATAAATQAAVATAAPTAAPTDDPCLSGPALATVTVGKLTMGTDNPAFPPYFEGRKGGNTEPWDPDWGDPTAGNGFESAMAYAIADQLGFSKDLVTWVPIAFNTSFAPGPKDFDIFIGQVTFNADRAKNADLSDGYYFGNQTIVVMADSDFADATKISDFKDAELGAQVGTTSLATIEEVIKPTAEVGVYNTTDDAIEAMQNGQIDGIVVDLPTASFITGVQVEGSKIVGQIGEAAGAEPEHFSLVLEQGSALTACANQAITALTDDGTIDVLTDRWLPFSDTPELQP
jgi:polar amino acid transport system substrate-binding protein